MPEEAATQTDATNEKPQPKLDTDAARAAFEGAGMIDDASGPATGSRIADATGDDAQPDAKPSDNADATKDGKTEDADAEAADKPAPRTIDDLPGLTRRQREAAKSRKWTVDRVLALGEEAPAVLEEIADLRSQISRERAAENYEQEQRTGEQQDEAGSETQATSAADSPSALPDDFVFSPEDLAIDEATDELSATSLIEKLNQLVDSNRYLRQRVAAQDNADHARRSAMDAADADAFFEGLDERVFDLFGSGPMRDLLRSEPAYAARKELIDLAQGRLKQAFPDLPLSERLDLAVQRNYRESWARAQNARPKTRKAPTATSRPSDAKAPTPARAQTQAFPKDEARRLFEEAGLV